MIEHQVRSLVISPVQVTEKIRRTLEASPMESSLRRIIDQESFNSAVVGATRKGTQDVSQQMKLIGYQFENQLQLQQHLA